MNVQTLFSTVNSLLRCRELRFAVVHVTTRCNAKCMDRCNMWALKPLDMSYEDICLAIDTLRRNHFSVVYLTGGETGLYPHLVDALQYAKSNGLITSITTNGTISKAKLVAIRGYLDSLSVSVDHYNENIWDETKHHPGVSLKAKETIRLAKKMGMNVYAVTFLNPHWTTIDVEKTVRYVNDELGIPFALSYPYISTYDGTYNVGGKLSKSDNYLNGIRALVSKVLEMKLNGSQIATSTCYLREVLRAHDNLPLKYPCKAGRTILTVDCKLNVFPCYKKNMLFNLRDTQNLNIQEIDSSKCDNKNCMINCFKEASEASRENSLRATTEELLSNPGFYFSVLS